MSSEPVLQQSAVVAAGAYGLPKLKTSLSFREYEDFDNGFYFEYPRAWVKRTNHLRPGLYVSDFNVRSLLLFCSQKANLLQQASKK